LLTLYYVEHADEWRQLCSPARSAICSGPNRTGSSGRIGVTSHQRPLAAEMAGSGHIDALMIRYNAARTER
jgi:hypothetical protein